MTLRADDERARQARLRTTEPTARQPVRREMGDQASAVRWAVMRAIDTASNSITIQLVRMADRTDPTSAVAYGAELTAYPLPGYTAARYNIGGGVVPTPADPDAEELGTNFQVVRVNPDMTIEIPLKLIENPTNTDPHEEQV